jgi:hypothetical protein
MHDPYQTTKRASLLRDLVSFHEKRASEAEAFHEPEARHHRERAEKLRLILLTIEREHQQLHHDE